MTARFGWLFALGLALSGMGCGSGDAGDGFGDPDGGGVDVDGGDGTSDAGPGTPGEDAGPGTPDEDAGPGCVPRSCEDASAECGQIADGCGGWTECGECDGLATCRTVDGANTCTGGLDDCEPATCQDLDAECGSVADGCGDVIDCGTCDGPGETCGLLAPNACDVPEDDPDDCPALRTCEDAGAECGTIGNGCGGTLDCGGCEQPSEICGALQANRCDAPTCDPLTCEEANPGGTICGAIPDGCGGLIEGCAAECEEPETCGGGGVPGECGVSDNPCEPATAEEVCFVGDCGPRSDGCGGTVDCGGCPAGESCGGSGEAGMCGAPPCEPLTCADQGIDCGMAGDGCGDQIDCGSCEQGQICGAVEANQCDVPPCDPLTCADQGIDCGMAGDGCGGQIDCGGCPEGESCGGGGVPSQCGSTACEPYTADDCDMFGVECGPMEDGCGGLVDSCGTCSGGDICGGGGEPSKCGGGGGDGGTPCEGLCEHQAPCVGEDPTTLTGRVYAPNGNEPLYNAMVYVPNGELPPIADGVTCDRCEDEDLGEPLVSAISGPDGFFQLRNVPAGVSFPLVIKMGKWRRVVTIDPVEECTTEPLGSAQTRLPRNQGEGHIPHIAVSTGRVDALECVLYKAGLDESEFTLPSENGRVHMYRANGARHSDVTSCRDACGSCTDYCHWTTCFGTCSDYEDCLSDCEVESEELYASQATLDSYDVVMFGCEASAQERPLAARQRLVEYLDKGGRAFLSHWNFDWIHNPDEGYSTEPLVQTANWDGVFQGDLSDPTQAFVDTSFPRGESFSEWLDHVNASLSPGVVSIEEPRAHVVYPTEHGRGWVHTTEADHGEDSIQYLSFNTPVGAEEACGRGVYTAFHVATGSHGGATFPNHCGGPLTDQEKVLLFMMFDLATCVADDDFEPPTCEPRTCAGEGAECGFMSDGCGGSLDCGTCPGGEVCVGDPGEPRSCETTCDPRTCGEAGAQCGYVADGCGGSLFCGDCTWPESCGAVNPNECDTPTCEPRSCADVGAECGYVADGCGDTVFCGTCPDGTACGGDGVPNECGPGSCMPQSCEDQGAECGAVGDGCGGVIECGDCPLGLFCGADAPNQCGGDPCPRDTCDDVGAECGIISDGCGGTRDCGGCPEPTICGGGGVPNQCGGGCEPLTCADQGAECGAVGDGCGDVVDCGPCPPGQTCGAGGEPNVCGDGPDCVPQDCEDLGAECGTIGDGCGDVVDCGECPEPTLCGGDGVPYQCGGGCHPLTCEEAGAECGETGDGCGGVLDCGGCPEHHFCSGSECIQVG